MWKFCAIPLLIEFVTYDEILLNVVLATWCGHYVSLSAVLPLSSSVICFLCSFCLWMKKHSNAVWQIVSGLPAVQRLCGMSIALQQGSLTEILNVQECVKWVAQKCSSDPYKDTTIISMCCCMMKHGWIRFLFSVSVSYLALYEYILTGF